LQKKRITAIKRLRLAGSVQIEFLWVASKIQLPLSPMLVSIFENAYKLELKQEIGNNIFSPAQ